jgi:hypothetical protein
MAFDAPRKTLDDIRRELDAEYGASAILDEQAARTEAEDTAPRDAPPRDAPPRDAPMDPEEEATIALARRERRRPGPGGWGGYVIAGLVGCIAGQILLFAALVALHYSSGSAVRASTPPMSEAPAERATPSASVASPPPVTAEPRDAAPAPEPTVAVPPATQFVPPATTPVSKAAEPRASVAAVMTQPASDEAKPAPRRSTRQTPAAAAAAPAAPQAKAASAAPSAKAAPAAPQAKAPAPVTPDSQDWARAQDEVRAALRGWLAGSHQDADVRASDTVVILGADGRTAKSHVRMRTAGGIVVHEQRWTREANGWGLVDNREAWRSDAR